MPAVAPAALASLRQAVLLLLTALITLTVSADENMREFADPRFGVSLAYPQHFIRVPSDTPVLLVLKDAQRGFPVFNLIAAPGDYELTAPLGELEEKVAASYRSVGFTSARVLQSAITETSGRPALFVKIQYESGGEPYISLVTIVPAGRTHFILTHITRGKDDGGAAADEYRSLLRSFRAPAPAAPERPRGAGGKKALLLAAALAAAYGARSLLKRRR